MLYGQGTDKVQWEHYRQQSCFNAGFELSHWSGPIHGGIAYDAFMVMIGIISSHEIQDEPSFVAVLWNI